MVKKYINNDSGKMVKAIKYDGTIESLQEIVNVFKDSITFLPSGLYIQTHLIYTTCYCVLLSDGRIFIYNNNSFKTLYTEYIPDRKFKCDRRIMIHLWKEVHLAPDVYTVSIINEFIVITDNITKNSVRITEALTIIRINPEYSFNSIEKKIIDMCKEIHGD